MPASKRLAYGLGVCVQIVVLGLLLLLAVGMMLSAQNGGEVFRYARF